MKYIILFRTLLIAHFLCIKCYALLFDNETLFEIDESIIPAEIVSNYVHKYLNPKEMFISISLSSSNAGQKYFQEKFIFNLLKNPKVNEFSNNILYKLQQSARRTVIDFNVILVDKSASLL